MPIFQQSEYTDFSCRPGLDEAWERLPVVATFDGLGARWLGPLVDLGHELWLGDLSQGAWGYLEGCGWQEALAECGPMLSPSGDIHAPWSEGFAEAVRLLVAAGEHAGPESRPDRWASWVAWAYTEPHDHVRGLAEANGWDR